MISFTKTNIQKHKFFIVERYLHLSTICVLWHDDFDFQPEFGTAWNYSSFVGINIGTLSTSFKQNVVDTDFRAEQLKQNELIFNELTLKLTISIETSHCEV